MKNNVIISCSVPFGYDGELTIVGKFPGHVLMMVRDSRSSFLGQIHQPKFMQKWIFAYSLGKNEPMYFFEYKLRDELRNPQRLLKSVRNKIMRAINKAHSEFENEMNQLEHQVEEASHYI